MDLNAKLSEIFAAWDETRLVIPDLGSTIRQWCDATLVELPNTSRTRGTKVPILTLRLRFVDDQDETTLGADIRRELSSIEPTGDACTQFREFVCQHVGPQRVDWDDESVRSCVCRPPSVCGSSSPPSIFAGVELS